MQPERVVTLVTYKLESYERVTLVWRANCMRQPKSQLPSSSPMQAGDSLTDVLRAVSVL